MRLALMIALFGAVLGCGSAQAAERPPAGEEALRHLDEAGRALGDAMAKALESVDILLQSLPRYDPPIVNENGDIIIRRRRPDLSPSPPPTLRPSPLRPPPLRTGAGDGMI
jgi:hypothetical protein